MIFVTMIIVSFGLACSAIKWSDLPDYYLKSSISSPDIQMALRYAAFIDRELAKENLTNLANRCDKVGSYPVDLLSENEAKAIYCYTLDTIIYKRINYALRSLNDSLLTAYTPYLKFLHRGIAKMPLPDKVFDWVCRSDGFDYGPHPHNSKVFLPISFSSSQLYCNFKFDPPAPICTIVNMFSWSHRRVLDELASINGEQEAMLLPGTVAVVLEDTPQNSTHCRIITLLEINKPLAGTQVTSLIPPYIPSFARKVQWHDDFLHGYYKPVFTVSVPKTHYVKMNTAGGYGDPYNPWPYITSIHGQTGPSSNLTVGQILVAVNEYTTRGMLHEDVELLLESTIMDAKPYTNYMVANR